VGGNPKMGEVPNFLKKKSVDGKEKGILRNIYLTMLF